MNVTQLGDGHPEVSIVACVHGDETNGAEAVDRFLEQRPGVQAPVQFIVANERAIEAGERSVDADLNRSFPGNRRSKDHEVALAADILKQVGDTKVLDIHSTPSTAIPHAFSVQFTMQDIHLIRSTGVDVVVDPTALSRGGFTSHCQGVTVECGPKGQPEAVDSAYEVIRNFLAANGVIDEGYNYSTDPQLFRIFDRIDYPSTESELHTADFEIVRRGEVFLTVDGEDIEAEQDFYPVMASDGNLGPPFVGFKAKNEGTISERLVSGP